MNYIDYSISINNINYKGYKYIEKLYIKNIFN